MENKDNTNFKDKYNAEPFPNTNIKSALENNKNDLVSNQGSSGVKNVDMVNKKSKIELEYQIRKERDYRDEENPMYSDADETWGAPDHF